MQTTIYIIIYANILSKFTHHLHQRIVLTVLSLFLVALVLTLLLCALYTLYNY